MRECFALRRHIAPLLLACVVLFGLNAPVYAASAAVPDALSTGAALGETMTLDAAARRLAETEGISRSDAAARLTGDRIPAAGDTYRILSQRIAVEGIDCGPTLQIYCQTSEDGNYWGIQAIRTVSMDSPGYSYSGTVYTNLESACRIYYTVNGNLLAGGATAARTVTPQIVTGTGNSNAVGYALDGTVTLYRAAAAAETADQTVNFTSDASPAGGKGGYVYAQAAIETQR